MADFSDDELLSELGIDLAPVKSVTYTAKEERLISGFEEITRFYEEHKKVPSNTPYADIFERIYAVRLAQLKQSDEAKKLLADFDQYGLLSDFNDENADVENLEDEDLLSELGIVLEDEENIFVVFQDLLRHVDKLKAMGQAGRSCVARAGGVVERHLDCIDALIGAQRKDE